MTTTAVDTAALERILTVRSWLAMPAVRLFAPRKTRAAIQQLVDEAGRGLTAADHLVSRPRLGSQVTLLHFDSFLHRDAGAVPGSTGIVVGHSKLSDDDDGVLVDWGNGRAIRADLRELTR